MGQVIYNGKLYTIYEMPPQELPRLEDIDRAVFREQNKQKRADWKNASRYGRRKK